MKFIYTKEKARDLKEQLNVEGQGGLNELEFADNTDDFALLLENAIAGITVDDSEVGNRIFFNTGTGADTVSVKVNGGEINTYTGSDLYIGLLVGDSVNMTMAFQLGWMVGYSPDRQPDATSVSLIGTNTEGVFDFGDEVIPATPNFDIVAEETLLEIVPTPDLPKSQDLYYALGGDTSGTPVKVLSNHILSPKNQT